MPQEEESATLVLAVSPSLEIPVVSPDSFLYNEIPTPVEAIGNSCEISEAPSEEEPEKVEINPCLPVSTDKFQLEVEKLYPNHEEDDIQCFQTTIQRDDSDQEISRTKKCSSLKTSRTLAFTSGG